MKKRKRLVSFLALQRGGCVEEKERDADYAGKQCGSESREKKSGRVVRSAPLRSNSTTSFRPFPSSNPPHYLIRTSTTRPASSPSAPPPRAPALAQASGPDEGAGRAASVRIAAVESAPSSPPKATHAPPYYRLLSRAGPGGISGAKGAMRGERASEGSARGSDQSPSSLPLTGWERVR